MSKRSVAGFTLVELSIVLVIIALLAGGLLLSVGAQQEQAARSITEKRIADTLDALIGYAAANGRLPCPAAPATTGVEAPPARGLDNVPMAADPVLFAAHLPGIGEAPNLTRLLLGAFASPWPGDVVVRQTAAAELARITRNAGLGHLLADLPAGTDLVQDKADTIEVALYAGHPANVTLLDALNGANRLLVIRDNGSTELIGFETALLVAPQAYRLGGLLRGLGGTGATPGLASSGAQVALVDNALVSLDVPTGLLGTSLTPRRAR